MIILVHHYVTILLAKMLIWAPFLQSMCTFYFCINPVYSRNRLTNFSEYPEVFSRNLQRATLLKGGSDTCFFINFEKPFRTSL